MKKKDIISFAFGNFFRRKTRSALTVLGVVIGTAAVVLMLSIGIGMNKGFEATINQWGNIRQIDVYKKYEYDNKDDSNKDQIGLMNDESFNAIKSLDHVAAATPQAYCWGVLINNKTKCQPSIMGISAADMKNFDYELVAGRLLDESDVGTKNFVMSYYSPFFFSGFKEDSIWDVDVTTSIEWPFDPLMQNYSFTWNWDYGNGPVDTSKPKIKLHDGKCVGILAKKAEQQWADNTIYMDIKGALDLQEQLSKEQNKYFMSENDALSDSNDYIYSANSISSASSSNQDIYNNFIILVDDTDYVSSVEAEIRKMGFETNSSMTYLTEMKSQSAFLRGILGAIGVVAFVVAALSIMNTMIMSIYERTREIGIMKVIGCKISDIRKMFLVEAGIIGFFGGIIGIGVSYSASVIVNKLASKGGGILGYQVEGTSASVIPFWLTLVALALATVVGILSGLYPAIRATRLSALEAIKSE